MIRVLFIATVVGLAACHDGENEPGGRATQPVTGSHIAVRVDGHDVRVPCEHLDEDFARSPPPRASQDLPEAQRFAALGGISESTGVAWAIRIPVTRAGFAAGAGDHPIVEYKDDLIYADYPSFSIKVKLPAGGATYLSQPAEVSPTTYHRVKIETESSTESTVTYRVRGEIKANMKKSGGGSEAMFRLDGDWSLRVTFPK